MTIAIKFCGLTRPDDVRAAAAAGAHYIGLNFFPRSPRYVAPEIARDLALDIPAGIAKVGLVVDLPDREIAAILDRVPLDILQLHGSESPERVAGVKSAFGLPVMKAVGIAEATDLGALDAHGKVADMLLVDAKPPPGASRPGGNAVAFDWRLIAGRRWPVPWLLAGGLTPRNVGEAIRLTGAAQVDVSSGVESAPGHKDAGLMAAFAAAAEGR